MTHVDIIFGNIIFQNDFDDKKVLIEIDVSTDLHISKPAVSLCFFIVCVFNFPLLFQGITFVLILFWMICMIRRCLGVGDLYSSWDGVDSWVDTQCPLITPHCVYIRIHYTRIYVYRHGVVCVARMMYGAPDIPKLRATLATSPRRHSLSRDWNICKCSQDDQHITFGKKHQEKL